MAKNPSIEILSVYAMSLDTPSKGQHLLKAVFGAGLLEYEHPPLIVARPKIIQLYDAMKAVCI